MRSGKLFVNQCCQPCGFPTNLGLFYCGFALETFGFLVLIKICLFFYKFLFCGVLFFKFDGTFAVSIYYTTKFRRVFVKICSFWACFFGFSLPAFVFNLPAVFLFYCVFLRSTLWACFFVKLPNLR